MSHSHLVIRHLIRQLEKFGPRTGKPRPLPAELTSFIDRVAEAFEPFQGVARPGFEAVQVDGVWDISMFLGRLELVGGPDDGRIHPVNFRLDLSRLTDCFDQLEELFWNAFPDFSPQVEEHQELSVVTASGQVDGLQVRLQVHAAAPEACDPGLRILPDGEVELIP